ncbi:MAG: hypothetical protein WBQ71_30420, partial [Trebonia sp.]
PVGRVAYLYWALIAVGAVLLGTGVALSARRLWKRSQDQRGGSLQVVPAYAGEPTSVQPDPWAEYQAPPASWNPAPQAPRDRAPQAPPWDQTPQASLDRTPQAPWNPAPPPDAPQYPESWVDPR